MNRRASRFTRSTAQSVRRAAVVLAALAGLASAPAHAQRDVSDLSAVSMLPVAVSVAAPSMLVAGASAFTVAAVEVVGESTVWVLERASDGARTSVHFAGRASTAVGTAVSVTAVAAGWIVSAAGAAIAFIPSEIGRALMYHERITR